MGSVRGTDNYQVRYRGRYTGKMRFMVMLTVEDGKSDSITLTKSFRNLKYMWHLSIISYIICKTINCIEYSLEKHNTWTKSGYYWNTAMVFFFILSMTVLLGQIELSICKGTKIFSLLLIFLLQNMLVNQWLTMNNNTNSAI